MTDLNQQQTLFGTGTPDGLQVELGNGSFTALHTAVGGTDGTVDRLTVELCNRTGGALDYTLAIGDNSANENLIVGTLIAKSGVVVALDARPVAGGQTVYGKASGVGINALAYVGRQKP